MNLNGLSMVAVVFVVIIVPILVMAYWMIRQRLRPVCHQLHQVVIWLDAKGNYRVNAISSSMWDGFCFYRGGRHRAAGSRLPGFGASRKYLGSVQKIYTGLDGAKQPVGFQVTIQLKLDVLLPKNIFEGLAADGLESWLQDHLREFVIKNRDLIIKFVKSRDELNRASVNKALAQYINRFIINWADVLDVSVS